jgi:hypothetical protein
VEKPSSGSESYSVESEQEFKVKKKKKTGMFSGFEMAFSNVRINTTLRFFDVLITQYDCKFPREKYDSTFRMKYTALSLFYLLIGQYDCKFPSISMY